MLIFLLFFCGLFIGSFLNVVADRSGREESFTKGRSYCERCKHMLAWYDLIPLFSYLFLKGKCRYCKKPIGWQYPGVEVLTGLLFAITMYFSFSSFQLSTLNSQLLIFLIFRLFIVSCLIIIFLADIRYWIIPFPIVFVVTIVTFFYILLATPYLLLSSIGAALGAFLFFLVIFLLTKGRGMGFGDVVYVFFMGLLLGYPNILLGIYIAFISGGLIAFLLILMKKKKLKGDAVPFGPFLVFGTFICLLWGDLLVQYILTYLGIN